MLAAPHNLRVNGLIEPLGIVGEVTLSWWVKDDRSAEIQSAFEVEVASSEQLLLDGQADLWQSGVSTVSQSSISYAGAALFAEQIAYWRVRTYDSDGLVSPWSEPSSFEMGLLSDEEWRCEWISPFIHGNRFQGNAVARLQKTFELSERLTRARLYVGAIGAYRVSVNGHEIQEKGQLDWADYSDYHYAHIFEITDYLLVGVNEIEYLLADGYATGQLPGVGREVFTSRPAIRGMLFCEGESSRRYEIGTDKSWSWLPSQISDAQTLLGEQQDGRQIVDDWMGAEVGRLPVQVLPIYSRAFLHPQETRPDEFISLGDPDRRYAQVPSSGPPFVVLEYDLGKTVIGAMEIEVVGRETDAIEISYAMDRTFKDSTVDRITTSGNRSSERYIARFAEHYFRYVRIRYAQGLSLPGKLGIRCQSKNTFFSNRITSDSKALQKLIQRIDTTVHLLARSAPLHGMRLSERLPDLGKLMVWGAELAWNPALLSKTDKWLMDAREGFRRYTNSAPYSGGRVPLPMDTDEYARFESLLSVLVSRYEITQDKAALKLCYPELRALALGFRHANDEGLRTQFREDIYGGGTDGLLVANALFANALRQFVLVAELLERAQDVSLGFLTLEQLSIAFRDRFLSGTGRLLQESQSALLGALVSEMLDDEELQRCQKTLVESLQKTNVDLPPALVRYLLPALSAAKRHDVACRLLLDSSHNNWLEYPQDFDCLAPHGVGVVTWIMQEIVGLTLMSDSVDESGRFALQIAPRIPIRSSKLTQLSCTLPLPCGEMCIAWQLTEDVFHLDVALPINCTAEVCMPDGKRRQLSSGRHKIQSNLSDGVPTLLDAALSE